MYNHDDTQIVTEYNSDKKVMVEIKNEVDDSYVEKVYNYGFKGRLVSVTTNKYDCLGNLVDSKTEQNSTEPTITETKDEIVVTSLKDETKVEVEQEVLTAVVESKKPLVVESTTDVLASFDTKAVEAILKNAKTGEKVAIDVNVVEQKELNKKQLAVVKELKAPVIISASVLVGNKEVKEFNGGKVTVTVPFTPEKGTLISEYTLVYINDNGQIEIVPTKVVDGQLVATLSHFSEYAVVKTEDAKKALDVQANTPATGDTMNTVLYAMFMLVSLLGLVFVANKSKKYN